MQKTKRSRFFVVAILIFSMVTMYADMSVARAASMDSVKDTVSSSDLSAVATHTIVFDMVNDLPQTRVITVAFNAGFTLGPVGNITCPANTTRGLAGQNVTCTVNGGATLSSTTPLTITVAGVTNPAVAGPYNVTVSTNNAIEAESSETVVYVISDVTVTAHVAATLTFGIGTVGIGTDVNGSNTTVASTASTIPFGNLTSGSSVIAGQQLTVTTNAANGFSVTVQQDQDMTSAAGATINAFVDGTVVAPQAWAAPSATLDATSTYGHMGITSSDSSLSTGDFYGTNLYAGLSGTAPTEVMYHNGPADGSTNNAGSVRVGYRVQISDLQEAGDYESALTYICTPTF